MEMERERGTSGRGDSFVMNGSSAVEQSRVVVR